MSSSYTAKTNNSSPQVSSAKSFFTPKIHKASFFAPVIQRAPANTKGNGVDLGQYAKAASLQKIHDQVELNNKNRLSKVSSITTDSTINDQTALIIDQVIERAAYSGPLSPYIIQKPAKVSQGHFPNIIILKEQMIILLLYQPLILRGTTLIAMNGM